MRPPLCRFVVHEVWVSTHVEVTYAELKEGDYVKMFAIEGHPVCMDIDLQEYASALSQVLLRSNEF